MPIQERPLSRACHRLAKAAGGMSGWRTMLCDWPSSSASLKPLMCTNSGLAEVMTPFRSVVERMLMLSASSMARPVTGRLIFMIASGVAVA